LSTKHEELYQKISDLTSKLKHSIINELDDFNQEIKEEVMVFNYEEDVNIDEEGTDDEEEGDSEEEDECSEDNYTIRDNIKAANRLKDDTPRKGVINNSSSIQMNPDFKDTIKKSCINEHTDKIKNTQSCTNNSTSRCANKKCRCDKDGSYEKHKYINYQQNIYQPLIVPNNTDITPQVGSFVGMRLKYPAGFEISGKICKEIPGAIILLKYIGCGRFRKFKIYTSQIQLIREFPEF